MVFWRKGLLENFVLNVKKAYTPTLEDAKKDSGCDPLEIQEFMKHKNIQSYAAARFCNNTAI